MGNAVAWGFLGVRRGSVWVCDKERRRTVDHGELRSKEGRLSGRRKVLLWRFLSTLKGMKDFLVCLTSGEAALFLWPIVMLVLFIIAMCWVIMKQCRDNRFCV